MGTRVSWPKLKVTGVGGLPGGGRPELSLDEDRGQGEGPLSTPREAGWGWRLGSCPGWVLGCRQAGGPKALSQTCGAPQMSPLSRGRNCIVSPESILLGSDEVFGSPGVLILSERARGKLDSLIALR